MSEGVNEESVTLTQRWLGMEPYTLITLAPASDGSGDPALHVEFGGGAENAHMMPLLVVTEVQAQESPVAQMLRDRWEPVANRAGVEAITREFNEDWLPFVRGEVA